MKELFPEIPRIQGRSIELRQVTDADAAALQRFAQDREVYRYLPTFLFEQKYEDIRYCVSRMYDECLDESLILGIFKKGQFAGLAEFYRYNGPGSKISVGYRLAREYWGYPELTTADKWIRQEDPAMDNIILIGMPASGKSTVGVILAKILGYDFVDTDLLIQRRERMKLEEIIEARGLEGFLQIEGEVCAALETERTVVATGGSAVYSSEAMEHLKKLGAIIYLRADRAELEKRIGDMRHRGVAMQEGQTFEDLYRERCALYERWADVTIDEGSMTLEDTATAAVRMIERD